VSPVSDRIELAIEKLTNVSSDLKAMIAVHDQRIDQQEKTTDTINSYLEKRREEMDVKLKDVYDTMRQQDNNILDEISKLRKESTEQHNILSTKINQLERYIYIAIGGGITITWLISYVANYFKILGH
jgi:sulfatase maturation enzyme AslB (radical SAM superfamily)